MKHLHFNKLFFGMGVLLLVGATSVFSSCKEDIDDSAYSIATKKTIEEYLTDKPELSQIKQIFDEVKLGVSDGASVVASALAARGNYTVFAPNNEAITAFIDSVTEGKSKEVSGLSDSQKSAIALNCIIDNGTSSGYETADFPTNGMFPTTNLKDRRISCKDVDGSFILNDVATVVESNLEASNGMLHVVDGVIVPSDKTVAELIKAADNMQIMANLLDLTGFTDSLQLQTAAEDEYEKANLSHAGEQVQISTDGKVKGTYQTKRYVGYTGFVETDDVFATEWGIEKPNIETDAYGEKHITNWDAIQSQLLAKCKTAYPDATSDDPKSKDNALYQFMAYHFMKGKLVMEDRSAVHHWNEYAYKCGDNYEVKSSENYTVNVWDYYSMMSGALIKITQVGSYSSMTSDQKEFFINRISDYNTDWVGENQGNYWEKSVKYPNAVSNGLNIQISKKNEDGNKTYENDGANGYYFPINHILVNTSDTKTALSSERMRIDFTTMFPEFISNEIRGNKQVRFTNDFFNDIVNVSTGSIICYMQEGYGGSDWGWKDYQGDEFFVKGNYDITVKLPRVPKTGTYELRLASSNNSLRSMVQVYLGENPNRLTPVGLPIDMRETVSMIPGNPWVADDASTVNYDKETCIENDRNLRNQGYMKAPRYFHKNGKSDSESDIVRNVEGSSDNGPALRRVLKSQEFKENQDYYMRLKLAIPDVSTTVLFLDYIELVPTSVYNGTESEDIW